MEVQEVRGSETDEAMPREVVRRSPLVIWCVGIVGRLVGSYSDCEDEAVVRARGGLDALGVAQRQPALRYVGNRLVSAVELVLVVQDVPWATMSWPPSTSTVNLLRNAVNRALRTVAMAVPARRISMLSCRASFFSRIVATSRPWRSYSMKVLRSPMTLPSPLKTGLPCSAAMSKSSRIERRR